MGLNCAFIPKIKLAWLCLEFILSKNHTKGIGVPNRIIYKHNTQKWMADLRRCQITTFGQNEQSKFITPNSI